MIKINENFKIATVSFIAIIFSLYTWMLIESICTKFGIKVFKDFFIYAIGVEICELICQYFVIKKYNNGRFSFDFIGMKFEQNSFRQLFIGIVIAMIICIICILVLSTTKCMKFKGTGFMRYPANKVIKDIIIAFTVSALAGFVEEIAYRGVIFNQLMQFKGEAFALIISSLIFMMFHGQYANKPYALFSVFLNGIIYGYLYIITGSLYTSIGLHFGWDFFLMLCSNRLLYFDMKNNYLSMYNFTSISIALMLILGLFLYRYKNRYKLKVIGTKYDYKMHE